MNKSRMAAVSLLLVGVLSPLALAQDKSKSDDKKPEIETTPIKLQVVVTEYEGDKKTKNLPYVLYLNAPHQPEVRAGGASRLRIGTRVPVYVGKSEMQYMDIGSNIDARAAFPSDGQLLLILNLERSWTEGDVPVPVTKPEGSSEESTSGRFREPIIRSLRSELDLKLREGQTAETLVATDPQSGKVVKVEVSYSTLK